MNKKYLIGIALILLASVAIVSAGSGKLIAGIIETGTLTATSTVDIALAGSNITSGTVADARIASTIARDSEVTSAILVNNNSVVAYVDAQSGSDVNKSYVDTRFTNNNVTVVAYVDAQDVVYNTSMKTYVDARFTNNNVTVVAYVDAQDVVYNTSMKTYVDASVTGNLTVECILGDGGGKICFT